MYRIILSAYRCDPAGVSEAYAGFTTAARLAERAQVLLCTPAYNRPAIERWLETAAGPEVRENLRLLTVPMPDADGRLGRVGTAIKPGFFLYDAMLRERLSRRPRLLEGSVVWHRTPISFRFRSSLYSLGAPFVVGPLGGGLKPPAILADYFQDEGSLYRLRRFDDALLASDFWMRPLDAAGVVLTTCDYVRDLLPTRLGPKTVTVLDTGVDVPAAPPARRRHPDLTFLFVGRLVRYKAPTLAIEAFAEFIHRRAGAEAGARLVIVGDGPERGACAALAAALGVADQVVFTGSLPKMAVAEQYEAADVFLFPSITEASGNVYLEAMRYGLPLVVTANGGGADIPCDAAAVKIPVAAYPDMVRAFAQALCDLAADPSRREGMGAAGFECVRENYSWPVLADKLLEAIARAAGR
jgi:glycosyltransferase involved in cell wall biosynthesis